MVISQPYCIYIQKICKKNLSSNDDGDMVIDGQKHKPLAFYALGFFAPYLERPCLRSLTPAKSRAPRTV